MGRRPSSRSLDDRPGDGTNPESFRTEPIPGHSGQTAVKLDLIKVGADINLHGN